MMSVKAKDKSQSRNQQELFCWTYLGLNAGCATHSYMILGKTVNLSDLHFYL